jgi:hypothetical protein
MTIANKIKRKGYKMTVNVNNGLISSYSAFSIQTGRLVATSKTQTALIQTL